MPLNGSLRPKRTLRNCQSDRDVPAFLAVKPNCECACSAGVKENESLRQRKDGAEYVVLSHIVEISGMTL